MEFLIVASTNCTFHRSAIVGGCADQITSRCYPAPSPSALSFGVKFFPGQTLSCSSQSNTSQSPFPSPSHKGKSSHHDTVNRLHWLGLATDCSITSCCSHIPKQML